MTVRRIFRRPVSAVRVEYGRGCGPAATPCVWTRSPSRTTRTCPPHQVPPRRPIARHVPGLEREPCVSLPESAGTLAGVPRTASARLRRRNRHIQAGLATAETMIEVKDAAETARAAGDAAYDRGQSAVREDRSPWAAHRRSGHSPGIVRSGWRCCTRRSAPDRLRSEVDAHISTPPVPLSS